MVLDRYIFNKYPPEPLQVEFKTGDRSNRLFKVFDNKIWKRKPYGVMIDQFEFPWKWSYSYHGHKESRVIQLEFNFQDVKNSCHDEIGGL